jgi:glycerophosphoryl diester phosphodiesterase
MKNIHFLIVLFFLFTSMSCQDKDATSMVIAHRGASYYAPENTVAAAELAWEQGADAVEIDVHLTADGQIVVMHDKDTERTAGEKFILSETPMDSLRMLEVGGFKAEKYTGESIPLLTDIVETLPDDKTLFVEIKSEKKIVPVLEEAFGDHPKVQQFVFIAFDYETIMAAKKAFPENSAYWLSSKFKADTRTELERVKNDAINGVNLKYSMITPEIMAIAEELGLEVYAWTVDDHEKARELQAMGVKGITTNMPDQILTALNNRTNTGGNL